ncbi:MAG: TPM domain-containing protein [Bacteroidota bacterium]
MPAPTIFDQDALTRIDEAICQAEKVTSGEIRLFVDRKCDGDVMDRAAFVFRRLNMHQTAERNGVLIYLAIESRRFAIIGDQGIHQHVGDDLWQHVRSEMESHFKNERFVEGVINGILSIGAALEKHFPYQQGDRNELPNQVVFGDSLDEKKD